MSVTMLLGRSCSVSQTSIRYSGRTVSARQSICKRKEAQAPNNRRRGADQRIRQRTDENIRPLWKKHADEASEFKFQIPSSKFQVLRSKVPGHVLPMHGFVRIGIWNLEFGTWNSELPRIESPELAMARFRK